MEKNKNRTDLLAAGRKKLQQFRQKKDNKGNNSKSSGKAGKPGRDATAVTATEAADTQQHAPDGESSARDAEVIIPLSESSSRVDSLASDIATATDELSAKPDILEISSLARAEEFPLEDSGVDETMLDQSADDGHNVDLVHEDAKYNVPGASDPMILKEKSEDSIITLPIDCSSELDRPLEEEQEVCNSCGDLSSNDLSETAGEIEIADTGNTLAEEQTHVATQINKTNNASLTGVGVNDAEVAQESHHDSTVPSTESGLVSTVSPVMTGQQREVISSGSSDEEKKEMLHISGGHGIIHTEGSQASSGFVDAEERFSEYKTNDSAQSLGCRPVDLSSVVDGTVIKLSQLAEILRVLDEDEIRFLSASRESSLEKFRDKDEVKVSESVVHDAFERLSEHLYVTSVSKDALHLQLSEHQSLIDEISALNSSLIEVQRKNELSAEEIVQCRYELQEVASNREELQTQLDCSKAAVEDFAAKVNELQNKLEMAQGGMSNLSSELVDCRNLVEALHAENEQLNGSYKLMTEEKTKLSEENGIILLENEKLIGELAQSKASLESLQTLVRDDRVRLEEENDSMLRENSILLVDLVVYKSTVETLEVENKNLNEILTSLSEERRKMEEEKTLVVHQTEQMSKEFMDCKDLVVALQTEISNLNGRLAIITEQRIKLEEEKMSIFSESEKQSHELAEIKVLVVGLQAECSKAVGDLKEATFGNTKLTEENEKLVSDLEFHKFKIKEFHRKEHSSQHEATENDICTLQKPNFDWSSLEQLKFDVYDDASGFVALKRNLEDALIVLHKLEKEIDGMHCYSTSLIRPTDKVAPGVSRLIQAFESKSHTDDQDPEQAPSSENQTAEDPYTKTKMVTENLRVRLKALVDDAQNASEFCRVMQNKLLSDATGTVRSQYDSLKEHTDLVEEANIELMVLYEAMKEHVHHAVAKEGELLIYCDVLQKQELVLKSENSQLREKLNGFQAKISELQSQLDGTCRDSVEIFTSISNQVQTLQAEVVDRESILEEEWKSVSDQVLQTIGVLDSTIKTFNLSSLAGEVSNLDVVGRVAASVGDADKVIKDLYGQLEAAQRDRQEISDKNGMALNTLHRLYNELTELVSRTSGQHETRKVVDDEVLDILRPDIFNTLLDKFEKLIVEKSQLVSANEQLSSDLINRAREADKLEKQCLKSDTIMKLVEEIEQSVGLEGIEADANEPASRLESLINFLVQKYKEADRGLSLSRSLEMQLSDLRGQVEHLNVVLVQTENENLVFKMSLKTAEEDAIALNSRVEEKVAELEQSEYRVSSLREKLSIAVTKGKGLISQRDSLKQSLAETSKELEKYSQELLSKDARIHELETKLKVYSEAGERMEALESELSYIRNSATALRESFLLKDSVLQRIEEVLEDLELPEHFHSRDIIEKIDWLAKSVGGNSLPLGEWDQRSSVGGGSYSDAGFVGADGLKEDMEPNSHSGDDLRWKYEELQNKFYGLAEQNEMLEQSLTERNNLVQRWEEILDRVDMPSQLRSTEPEDKIQWLVGALSEAQNHCYSLQKKVDDLEKSCGSLTADLEDLQRKTSELETTFQQACLEKDVLSRDLEILSRDNDENLKKTADFRTTNENLKDEVRMLQQQKLRIEDDFHHTENAVRRLQELVSDALQDSSTENVVLGQEGIEHFEEMLRELVEKYKTLFSVKSVNIDPTDVHVNEKEELSNISRDLEEQDVVTLSKKLEDSMGELMCLKEERDRYMLSSQSLLREVEELEMKKKELQDLLNQEEQKSASLREKLNVAVRKGKSLVQQRYGMKQVIEELNAEVERLKSQTKQTAMEHDERLKNLLTTQERLQATESENTYLRDRLAETEHSLQEKEGSWSSILDALDEIDVGFEFDSENPFEKLKEISKYLHDLRTGLDSLEQESRKSKRAAELLLAELNEVQERNDGLQEELANAVNELSELSREKELAENAKYEALEHVEKLSDLHSEERDRLFSEIMLLKSGVDNTREDLSAIERELGDVLSKDLEVLHNMKDMIKSCLESGGTPDVIAPPSVILPRGIMSRKSETKVFTTEIGSLRERFYNHSNLLKEETSRLSEVVMNVHREYVSQKDLYESVKRDVKKFEMIEIEKESELHILQENISLLYETCTSAISEIENWKDSVDGNTLASRAPERNLKFETHTKGANAFNSDTHILSKEGIRSMSDKLLLVVRDFISMQNELMEVGQRDMKSTIMNLQKEVQEKDIQRERICMELVNQIKEAETNAKSYLHDLQQTKLQLRDSQRQLDAMAEERKVLEQEMKELQDQETNSTELQQKVNSLTDALAAKVQEAEALMQALDEEESEMEHLTNKIGGLESELQQKNNDLENLEVSRAKALKKLSITVSKFDELHYFSESLLSEVEKLQSQLQERDGEISFLRQEVTRCTNDALAVTQMSKKRSSDELLDLLSWLDSLISRVQVHDVASDDSKTHLVNEYKEVLQKRILGLIHELENLRVVTQNSDMVLQEERSKVEELAKREQYLKNSLREKESELLILQRAGESAKATKSSSEIVEVEQMTNTWALPGNIAPQVRSLRKTNNDQVAIAIDVDHNSDRLEDDDDDKAHGFKSLTTSKIVPRFTRPVSDMVDGLWVSCDRALMRQPALRLGVIIYWAVLHAMLAIFVV